MTQQSSSFQRNIITTTLRALIVFLLMRGCDTATSFSNIDPPATGFMITGKAAGGMCGHVSTAGDINNDGYDDIIVGAPDQNQYQGGVYVIYGGPKSSLHDIDLNTTILDPATTGFIITANGASDQLGWSVSKAGDVNNDGYDDIIVGAHGKNFQLGAAYVIYGGPTSSMSNIDLSTQTLDPLTTGFMITGSDLVGYLGISVSTVGDINKDGYDDIIIGGVLGAFSKIPTRGIAYVIYGGSKSAMSNIDLSKMTLDPLTTGFNITGKIGENLGHSIRSAGDFNNDGYDDIIVGAYLTATSYVIYGGEKSAMSNIDLSEATLDPVTTGFWIKGNISNSFGWAANTVGDINSDGYDDIIISAGAGPSIGKAYVIYGGPKSSMANIDLSSTTLNPLTTGFVITANARRDDLGSSVSTAGDVNNDGYDDILIGADGKDHNQGAAYVIYGGPKSLMSNIDLRTAPLDPETTGFTMMGGAIEDQFGQSVSTAGDLDHDGYDDIIIGAHGKDNYKGAAYVIYGGPRPSNIDF